MKFPLSHEVAIGQAASIAARHLSYRGEGENGTVRAAVELDLPENWCSLDDLRTLLRGEQRTEYVVYGAAVPGDELFKILHLRPMASKQGWYKWHVRNSVADYLLGYHPLFKVVRFFYPIFHRPRLLGRLLILLGYVRACLRGKERIVTPRGRGLSTKNRWAGC